MKNLIVLILLATAFFSCESDDSNVIQETEIAQVIGNWELYRDENLEAVIAGPDAFIEGTVDLDLAVDSKQRIYTIDNKNKAVRIFSKKENI